MSTARLVITAVVVEGRSQSEVARTYVVSQSWISRLVARYRAEGETAFTARSRRPQTSPTRLPNATIALIIAVREDLASKGLDNADQPNTGCGVVWLLRWRRSGLPLRTHRTGGYRAKANGAVPTH
jgi:hypothetical protein